MKGGERAGCSFLRSGSCGASGPIRPAWGGQERQKKSLTEVDKQSGGMAAVTIHLRSY